ncbi:hypothetical protein TIFTF001_034454, partial [Ficus carica]
MVDGASNVKGSGVGV